jgi:hypothetical protein
MRRLVPFILLLVGIAIGYYLWPGGERAPAARESHTPKAGSRSDGASDRLPSAFPPEGKKPVPDKIAAAAGGAPSRGEYDEAEFPIAAALNAPGSSVGRDLDIISQIFDAWLSNFPSEGNPVGENAEITAALMGDNRLQLALIPKGHRAVNENGELCDRWGTPFRFHQLSGTRMEIQSAGPDRKFATADDAKWTPQ